MLIVFSGLPATGKTTISRAVARQMAATYIRIDTIEQALRADLGDEVGAAGYRTANAIAEDNLKQGRTVVADCVNPVAESRQGWREVAQRSGCKLVEVEVVCSDPAEHRRRAESRVADIRGHTPPDWQTIKAHHYESWDRPHLIMDSSTLAVEDAVRLVVAAAG